MRKPTFLSWLTLVEIVVILLVLLLALTATSQQTPIIIATTGPINPGSTVVLETQLPQPLPGAWQRMALSMTRLPAGVGKVPFVLHLDPADTLFLWSWNTPHPSVIDPAFGPFLGPGDIALVTIKIPSSSAVIGLWIYAQAAIWYDRRWLGLTDPVGWAILP